MTALTSGIGLVPLALAAGQPGKEILYPVATVIIGGLMSCTLLEFLVRPALFAMVGFRAGERLVAETAAGTTLEGPYYDTHGHIPRTVAAEAAASTPGNHPQGHRPHGSHLGH
jgi:hypothetical protein